jgi:hypothetical protein
VEARLLVRGVLVSYEAIRKQCRTFSQAYANQLRRRRPRPGDTWHLEEVFLTIQGERHYRWQAIDLDMLAQRRRHKAAFPSAPASVFCFGIPARNATTVPKLAGNSELPHRRIRVATEAVRPLSAQ